MGPMEGFRTPLVRRDDDEIRIMNCYVEYPFSV